MGAILKGNLPNFSKYDNIEDYMGALNSKLAALGKPQIPNLTWLDDACLNKWLGQLGVMKSRNVFDGDLIRVRGYESGAGGPSWKEMMDADKLL